MSKALGALLAAALGLSLLLLGVASLPDWIIRGPRLALFVTTWRLQIGAAGFSTLFAAAIVFVIASA